MVLKKTISKGLELNYRTSDVKAELHNASSANTTIALQPNNEKSKELEESKIKVASTGDSMSDYVAPEGGWGWMVTLGLIVVFVTVIGPSSSFTIVFGDFLESTGQAGSSLTMLNSLFNISYSLSSFLTDPLLKRYSMRTVGIIGAILFSIPNTMAAMAQHVVEMGIYSFIEGIGLGFIFTICNANFNNYFDKKRSMVMGISQVIIGLGGIMYPIGTELLLEEYGFRGTAAITGALSLNCITAMALMRPPTAWKAKFRKKLQSRCKENDESILANNNNDGKDENEEKSDESKKLLPVMTDFSSQTKQTQFTKKENQWGSCRSLQHDHRLNNIKVRSDVRRSSITDVEKNYHENRRKSHLDMSFLNKIKLHKSHLTANFTSLSLTSLRMQPAFETLNHAALPLRASTSASMKDEKHEKRIIKEVDDVTKNDDAVDNNNRTMEEPFIKKRKQRFYSNFVNFSLLKSYSFQNMCMGMSFVMVSDFTFTSFLPMMITSRGFTKADAALTLTVSASAELVSKICLAIFTIFVDVRPKTIFFFAMVAMTVAKLGYLLLEDTLPGTIVMIAVIGTVRSWLFVPQSLVVVENLNVDQYAAAYGIFAIVSGVISAIFGPFAGLVKDWTDSFMVCHIVLISMNSLFIIPWAIEMWLKRKNNRDLHS